MLWESHGHSEEEAANQEVEHPQEEEEWLNPAQEWEASDRYDNSITSI